MKNNTKVAVALLDFNERGLPISIQDISTAAGVHYVETSNLLRYWRAVGWVAGEREGTRIHYSITEQGEVGFKRLILADG